jgi:hypothetical protein
MYIANLLLNTKLCVHRLLLIKGCSLSVAIGADPLAVGVSNVVACALFCILAFVVCCSLKMRYRIWAASLRVAFQSCVGEVWLRGWVCLVRGWWLACPTINLRAASCLRRWVGSKVNP